MDILIKSFNRPFYLDRCLASIYKFVEGSFKITVLDDGTPERYLEKIQQKYPSILIKTSKNYLKKTLAIKENLENGQEINGLQIPVDLWIEAAKNASEFFIITEDDVWFTDKINTDELVKQSKKFQINLLKLGWLGNKEIDQNTEKKVLSNEIISHTPKKLFLSNTKIMKAFFYNHFYFYSLLYKLKIVDNLTREKYWHLNSILMGLYKKEYWLEIWKNMDDKVDEKKQLVNAATFYKKHQKNRNFISRLKNEVMKTTFQSSATSSYHKYTFGFEVNLFNHLVNEAWFIDNFDVLQNFPKDFSVDYFEKFIADKIDINEFKKWIAHFKYQYENLGADVN